VQVGRAADEEVGFVGGGAAVGGREGVGAELAGGVGEDGDAEEAGLVGAGGELAVVVVGAGGGWWMRKCRARGRARKGKAWSAVRAGVVGRRLVVVRMRVRRKVRIGRDWCDGL